MDLIRLDAMAAKGGSRDDTSSFEEERPLVGPTVRASSDDQALLTYRLPVQTMREELTRRTAPPETAQPRRVPIGQVQ